eukprot:TRINITY_DN42793_c0_g1_i1.p1 TRINITY_DN42793_c0_g1~~TRINITY_DN42793_c0_g1_i1.p1  ORF type:complete len:592 (-),score=90.97 TRINITY_DN42793_c0_g1_i1:6-1781(-)
MAIAFLKFSMVGMTMWTLMLIHTIFMAHKLFNHSRFILVKVLSSWQIGEGNPNTRREFFARSLAEKVSKRFGHVVPLVGNLSAVAVFLTAINIHISASRWMSREQDIIIIFFFAITIAWNAAGAKTRCLRLFCLNSFAISTILWVLSADGNFEILTLSSAITLFPRTLIGSCIVRVKCVAMWNALHVIVIAIKLQQGKVGRPVKSSFIVAEFFVAVFIVAGIWFLHEISRADVQAEMDLTATQSEHKAATVLLEAFCDATVELDESFHIVDDTPMLAALLLHGSGRSLRGTKFPLLIAQEEDRERFENFARSEDAVANRSKARSLHAELRDSLNNSVSVDLFVVPFSGSCDQIGYRVGILEQADYEHQLKKLDEPIQVMFDATTLKVIARSGAFNVGTSAEECERSHYLSEWLVQCKENEEFLSDIKMAVEALNFSNNHRSLEANIVLRNLLQLGHRYLYGQCVAVRCTVKLELEQLEQVHADCSVGDEVTATIEGAGTAAVARSTDKHKEDITDEIGLEGADTTSFSASRIIATALLTDVTTWRSKRRGTLPATMSGRVTGSSYSPTLGRACADTWPTSGCSARENCLRL